MTDHRTAASAPAADDTASTSGDTRPIVAGLRELADFLEDHPALPEPSSVWAYRSDWAAPHDHHEARGELGTVATILGVAPQIGSVLRRVTVSRAFGPDGASVSYEVQWPIDAVTEPHEITAVERRLPADLENLGAGGEA